VRRFWVRLAAAVTVVGIVAACAPPPAPVRPPAPPAAAPRPETPVPVTPPAAPPPTAPVAPTLGEEPRITVGLAWDLRGVTLDPQGTAVAEGASRHVLRPDEQLAVSLEGGRASVRALAGRVRWQARLAPGETLIVTPEEGTTIVWNDRHWRGQMRVFLNPRGRLTLATRLGLEAYLEGVVPGEIGSLGEDVLEAGRAQAIAARSFTLFYRGRRAVEGFDVFATVEDQLYVSVEGERELATRCVQSTAGMVALSNGSPVRANYCSTCGGITAEVWEAWPEEARPYLMSHRDRPDGGEAGEDFCAASRHFRWREEWTPAELIANLTEFCPAQGVPLPGRRLGSLEDVRVDARSRSGRVWRLVVETSAGRIVIPAWSMRQVLRRPGNRQAILRSNLFKIGVRRDPRTNRVVAVVASGAGNGHGVGLCQTGALGMARRGRSADEILTHYYRGAEVRRLY